MIKKIYIYETKIKNEKVYYKEIKIIKFLGITFSYTQILENYPKYFDSGQSIGYKPPKS